MSLDSTDYYDKWVNDAYLHITTRRDLDFPEMHVSSTDDTADGTATLSSIAGTLYVEEIFDDTSLKWLKWIPWSKYVSYTDRADTAKEGKPTEWHRRGTVASSDIFLHPTPDAVYTCTIFYRKKPTLLSSTAVTAIGDEWDEPIVTLAVVYGLRWLHEFEKADKLFQAWAMSIAGLAGVYGKEELARRENIQPNVLWTQGKDGYR